MRDLSLLEMYMEDRANLVKNYPFLVERYKMAVMFGNRKDIEVYGLILSWAGIGMLLENICNN